MNLSSFQKARLFIILSAVCLPFATAIPQEQPVGQDGSIQMPLRECALADFGQKKGDPVVPQSIGAFVQGPAGDDSFYSTTRGGGDNDKGTVFKTTLTGVANTLHSDVKVLHSFAGGEDGRQPQGGLTLSSDGDLYGTTNADGHYGGGTIFKISRAGSLATLYSFRAGKIDPPPEKGQQPSQQQLMDSAAGLPSSAPVEADDGFFYGVTAAGAAGAAGTLYQVSTSGAFKVLHVFEAKDAAANGSGPVSLSKGKDGFLYGVTSAGGLKWGTVFQFDPRNASGANGGITTIYKFNNVPPKADGSQSFGVIQGTDENLYGTMSNSGPGGRGLVFRLTLAGVFTPLHWFFGNASNPVAGVVEVRQLEMDPADRTANPTADAYYLYGATSLNWSISTRFDSGVIYRVREDGTEYSAVYNFEGPTGLVPTITPVLGRDSNLYGATAGGGTPGQGVFYRLNTSYWVTGASGTDRTTGPTPHQEIVFAADPKGSSVIWDDRSPAQVVTHMAGFQPTSAPSTKVGTMDGITVRVKDSSARIVQFFYRARFDAQSHPIIASGGVSTTYDPASTYSIGDFVRFNQQGWISAANNNKGNSPPQSVCGGTGAICGNDFWRVAYWDGKPPVVDSCSPSDANCTLVPPCQGLAGGFGCDALTTNEAAPVWIADAFAHKPDPYYVAIDTQVDCDGFTLFDSPSLSGSAMNEHQVFEAIDFVISSGKVVATVTWRLEKEFAKPEDYTWVSITGPPDPNKQKQFRDVLKAQGYTQPF